LPARELLGDLLTPLKKPAEAKVAYEKSLQKFDPGMALKNGPLQIVYRPESKSNFLPVGGGIIKCKNPKNWVNQTCNLTVRYIC